MDIERASGEMEMAAESDRLVVSPPDDVEVFRQAQIRALRSEIAHLRSQVSAIVSGTSRLAVTKAVVALETTENSIRNHLVPVLIAAGAIGYLWGISFRHR